MKITINTDNDIEELHIEITCRNITPDIEKIAAMLRMMDKKLTCKRENQIFIISVNDVLYIEAVDRKCFLYTKDYYYETDFKLYELEEELSNSGFFRISKSMIINLRDVKSLKAEFNRRLLVNMCNGEQIIVSRQYADKLKRKLGV